MRKKRSKETDLFLIMLHLMKSEHSQRNRICYRIQDKYTKLGEIWEAYLFNFLSVLVSLETRMLLSCR